MQQYRHNKLLGKSCLLFLFLLTALIAVAQTPENTTEEVISRIYEQMSSESEDDIDFTTLEEDLTYFAQNPVNLNNTSKEELERLQFLSDIQIENLLYYLYRNSPMQTIYELQLVEGFDMFVIRNLLPFVTVGPAVAKQEKFPAFKQILKQGKNELLWRTDRTLEQKQGYRHTDNDSLAIAANKKYLGDPFYLSLRYNFRYRDRISAGFTAEKDAGEQFLGAYHKGFDYYSAYLQINDLWHIKYLVIGNYRANFGQGLVIHPEMVYGKSGNVLNILPRNAGIRKTSSTDEYNYMRGIGATLKFGKLETSLFFSYRYLDGDSTGGAFSTIKTDGLHRTLGTLQHKNTIAFRVAGGNINYIYNHFRIGVTITDSRLSVPLIRNFQPYNRFYFSGNHQMVGGINYQLRVQKFNFFGETATASTGGIASINGTSISAASTVNLALLYRYYSPRYDVLLSNAFATGSRANNEDGLYIGAEVRPFKKWKITAYADSYRFPWMSYLINSPSTGYDILLAANFIPTQKVEMYWRLRFWEREKNLDVGTTNYFTGTYTKQSLQYFLTYSIGRHFKLKNVIELNRTQTKVGLPSYGSLFSQELTYSFAKSPLSAHLRYEFFDASNYDNRIYSYEQDILYVFSTPMLYGKGSRYYVNIQYNINKNLSLWLKVVQTCYTDTETIGTGLEQINAPHRTEIRGLLRWRF